MWRFLRCVFLFVFLAGLKPGGCAGQDVTWRDTVRFFSLQQQSGARRPPLKLRFTSTTEYAFSVSGSLLVNWQKDQRANQVALQHSLRHRSVLTNNLNLVLTTCILHNLGLQCFFDSITRFSPDENTLDTRLDLRIGRFLSASLSANLTTRLFNGYEYLPNDSGLQVRILTSAFMTPVTLMLSAGITVQWKQFGTLTAGLSGGKLTGVVNRQIWETRDGETFYGVQRSKGYLVEYGWTLQVLIDRDLFPRVHWNCDLLLFKNPARPPDLSMRNYFGIKINRFLCAGIQTRLYYEAQLSPAIQLENLVSLGFSVSL